MKINNTILVESLNIFFIVSFVVVSVMSLINFVTHINVM